MNDQITAVKDAATKAANTAVTTVKSAADRAPKLTMPTITLPEVKIPDVKIPDVKIPDVKIPDVKIPDVKIPDVKVPSFTLSPDVQSYVDAASKSASQASQTIRSNVSSSVTLLREAIGR